MNRLSKQKGMTVIGWIFVLALIAFFSLITMKIVPMYSEYFNVVAALEAVGKELKRGPMSKSEILASIERRFQINYVQKVTRKDIKITKTGRRKTVTAKYEARENLFGNIDIVIRFEKTVGG